MKTWYEASTSGYCSRELKRNLKVVYCVTKDYVTETIVIVEMIVWRPGFILNTIWKQFVSVFSHQRTSDKKIVYVGDD